MKWVCNQPLNRCCLHKNNVFKMIRFIHSHLGSTEKLPLAFQRKILVIVAAIQTNFFMNT